MTKNEALEKAQVTVDNDKRRTILEKRLARLENLIKNESADDPNVILLEAVADGVVSWEVLCRELMANVADDALWTTCSNLGLIEDDMMEASKESDKPVKNEDAGNDVYDAASQWARDYIDQLDEDDYWVQQAGSVREALQIIADEAADPIVDSCCDDLESEYAFELSDSDRDVVASALAAAAEEAMQYMGDDEDWDDGEDWDEDMEDEEFESRKRVSRKQAKNEAAKKPVKKESMKRPAKRSLVSRFHK